MKKFFLPLLFLGILVLPGCLFEEPSEVLPYEIPTENGEVKTAPEIKNEELSVESIVPQEKNIVSANIIVESPSAGDVLSSPFEISGRARVFENVLNVDVKKEDGTVVISEVVLVRANDIGEFGTFSLNLDFQFTQTRKGTIEIYSLSPKDGSKENMVVIPVEFKALDRK